jgi:uncharacterized protein YehS (DUF1456 family)
MFPHTIKLLARNILNQRQPLMAARIRMTDWLMRRRFRVAAALRNTNLLQILRKIVGTLYSVVWILIQFRVYKYGRYATEPYSI